jgi:hypothetical protein
MSGMSIPVFKNAVTTNCLTCEVAVTDVGGQAACIGYALE